jgi:iron(III) transport system permease protein
VGASGLALVLGTATGYLTTRIAFRGRRFLFVALLLPFFLPGYVYSTAWIELLAREALVADAMSSPSAVYSLWSAMLVLALHLFPWIHLVAGAGFASIEGHLDDAARLTLSGPQRFAKIALPLVVGVLASAGLFVFVIGMKSHNIPMLLRQRVFATEIMIAYEALGDDRGAALLGLVCAAVSLAALGLALWVALRRRRIAIEGLSSPWRDSGHATRAGSAIAALVALAVFVAAAALPMMTIVRTAGAWSNYRIVWQSAWPQVANGLVTASAVATLSVILGFLLAEQIGRSGRVMAALTVSALLILFAMPAPVLDLGLIRFWNRPGPMGWVYDSRSMLVLGQTAAFLPIAVLGLSVASRRIDPHLIEAAEMAGVPWRTIALRILWPMLRVWLIGVWAVVFVLSLNDAETAVLLAPAGQATLSVRIMTLLHYAPDAHVSALCVIQVIATAAAIGFVAIVGMVWSRKARWKSVSGSTKEAN